MLKRTIFNVSHFQSDSESLPFLRPGKYVMKPSDSGTGKTMLHGLEIKTKVIHLNALGMQESICKTGWEMGLSEKQESI